MAKTVLDSGLRRNDELGTPAPQIRNLEVLAAVTPSAVIPA
ncbi:MAG TPA: hypothetical protein PK405_02845 [Hyphomicrobiales bacterium]|nr:hypothetical protein [Hyphomicrobiales bacterium]